MARQSEPLMEPPGDHRVPVLVTRPRAEAETFAATLTARFGPRVRPVVTPLIVPRLLSPTFPGHDHAAVVFTSAQGVEAARRLDRHLPSLAWCVGRKTAAVATAAGFQARSADGDVNALAKAILQDPPKGRILYLHGVDTHGNLQELLQSSGMDVDALALYRQDPQPLTAAALSLLRAPGPLLVPLFSPRTAGLFRAALPPDAKAPLHVAVMSAAVAEALADVPRAALAIASRPDAPAMLAAVESLLAGLSAS